MTRPIRGPLIIDTGPLLTYLCLRFLNGAPKAEIDRALLDLRNGVVWDAAKQSRCLEFLGSPMFGKRLTTSHVLWEVLRIRKSSYLADRRPGFVAFAIEHLAMFIDERPILLKDLDRTIVARFGPTDAGVLRLAHLESGTIITDDERLYSGWRDPGIEIRQLEHILDEF